jgi:hypothetical protein
MCAVGGALRLCVQRLGPDVGVVGPDDRAGLDIRAELREAGRVTQRLEHATVVEQVGEVHVGCGAVREPDVRDVPIQAHWWARRLYWPR